MKFTKRGAQEIIVFRNDTLKMREICFIAKKDSDYSIELNEFQKLFELIQDLKDKLLSFFLVTPKG